jgi:N-methylhydantoinase A
MLVAGDEALVAEAASIAGLATDRYRSMFGREAAELRLGADMRYRGQSHELEVPWGGLSDLGQRFHAMHRERFGFDRIGEPVEVVNVRATAAGEAPMRWTDLPGQVDGRQPSGSGGVWARASLPPGFAISGPGVIVEDNSATLLEPGDQLTVLADGTLRIDV